MREQNKVVVVPFKVKELVLDCSDVPEQVVDCSDVRLQVKRYFIYSIVGGKLSLSKLLFTTDNVAWF